MLRIDLHVHSSFSKDGFCPLSKAIKAAKARGLNGIAITDHNTIAGHAKISHIKCKDFVIIPGVEISSKDGHILGLGINKLAPRDLPAAGTVAMIRKQGGIAIAAHPFSPIAGRDALFKAKFDAVEVFNSRAYFLSNSLARRFAEKHRLPMSAGSDAHFLDEIGLAGVELNCEPDVDEILKEIPKGRAKIFGRTLPFPTYMWRAIYKYTHKRQR